MANKSGILAAEAYVELSADDKELLKSLNTSSKALEKYSKRARVAKTATDQYTTSLQRLQKAVTKVASFGTKLSQGMAKAATRMQQMSRLIFDVLAPGLFYLGTVSTIIGGAIAGGVAVAAKAFMNLEDVSSRFNVVFGESAKGARKWASDFAKAIGFAESTVMETMAEFRGFFGAQGFSADIANAMSEGIARLVPDLSSFFEMDPARVQQLLFSGLTGQAEAVRRLGVDIYENSLKGAFEGIGIDPSKATQQQKVLVRYNQIVKQTAQAQGDLARTSDSLANVWVRMKETFKEAQEIIGGQLSKFLSTAAEAANRLLRSLLPLISGPKFQKFAQMAVMAAGGLLAFGAVATTLAPIVTAFGTIATFVTTFVSALVAIPGMLITIGATIVKAVLNPISMVATEVGKIGNAAAKAGKAAFNSGKIAVLKSARGTRALPADGDFFRRVRRTARAQRGSSKIGPELGRLFGRIATKQLPNAFKARVVWGAVSAAVGAGMKAAFATAVTKGGVSYLMFEFLSTVLEAPLKKLGGALKSFFGGALQAAQRLAGIGSFAIKVLKALGPGVAALFDAFSGGDIEKAVGIATSGFAFIQRAVVVAMDAVKITFMDFFKAIGDAVSKLVDMTMDLAAIMASPLKAFKRMKEAQGAAEYEFFTSKAGLRGGYSAAGGITKDFLNEIGRADLVKKYAKEKQEFDFGAKGVLSLGENKLTAAQLATLQERIDEGFANVLERRQKKVLEQLKKDSPVAGVGGLMKRAFDQPARLSEMLSSDPELRQLYKEFMVWVNRQTQASSGSGMGAAGAPGQISGDAIAMLGQEVKKSSEDSASKIAHAIEKSTAESASIFEKGVFTRFKQADKTNQSILNENKQQTKEIRKVVANIQNLNFVGVSF